MKPKIKIPGHSGSKLIIGYDRSRELFVNKISSDARLIKQARKQKSFADRNLHKKITSPAIVNECTLNKSGYYSFKMKYVAGFDMISFMSCSSIKEIEIFVKILLKYFETIIHNSETERIANDEISKKFKSVYRDLKKNKFVVKNKNFKFLCSLIELIQQKNNEKEIILPVGECHGDLTFSNMMYNTHTKKIVVFDFLDTYFESPVQDMIKLKQDLVYDWTFKKMIDKKEVDKKRYDIVKAYLDKEMESYFKSFQFYKSNYKMLQALNLLRIVVYSKDCTTIDYLIKCIEDLYER